MPGWPTTFPELFEVAGFTFDPVSNAMVDDTESGEPMTRLRFTGEIEDVAGNLDLCDRDTANAIVDFWRHDLKNGTLRLSWDHPMTGEAVEFLIVGQPQPRPAGSFLWRVGLRLKRLPT